jgi:hypothetical protein
MAVGGNRLLEGGKELAELAFAAVREASVTRWTLYPVARASSVVSSAQMRDATPHRRRGESLGDFR